MSQKIIIEGIYQWNDETNQFDTVFEDSIDYDGYIMQAQEGPDGTAMGEEAADDFDDAFKPSFEDAGKSLEKVIKAASKKAAKGFGGSFASAIASQAKAAQTIIDIVVGDDLTSKINKKMKDDIKFDPNKNMFDELANWDKTVGAPIKAAVEDAAADLEGVMEGALTGVSDSFDLRNSAADFGAAMRKAGFTEEEINEKLAPIRDMANSIELKEMEKNFTDSVEEGISSGLGFIPSNAFTKALGIDAGIKYATKQFSKSFMKVGAGVGKFLKENWGAALGIGLVVALLVAVNSQFNEIGENFGAIGFQSENFVENFGEAKAIAAGLGIDVDGLVGGINALTSGLGIGNDEALKLSAGIMDTAKATGMSVDEMGTLFSTLVNVNGQSEKTANNFTKQAAMLAEASNVAPKQVLADMSESSEEIAKFSKGTGENMGEAAVKAAQLGLSLSDVAEVAEGLLDFESSISSEMEAAVILGRDLNLQRARELALAGDMVGLQDELLNQVGSQAEFEAMNVIERKALADAIGLSVSQVARLTAEAGKSRDELMSMKQFSGEELIGKDAFGAITKFTNMIKQAGLKIMAGIGGAFEGITKTEMEDMVAGLKDVGTWIGKLLVLTLKWGKAVAIATASFAILWAGFKIAGMVKGMAILPKVDIPGKGGPFGTSLKSLAGGLKAMGDTKVFKGIAAMALFAPVAILSLAAMPFLLFMAIPLGGLWATSFAGLATGLTAMGASKQIFAGILALGLLGIALIPATYAFSLLAGVDASSIIAFSASLIVLAAATTAFGLFLIGGGFILFGAGILALVGLGGAILLMGKGMSEAAPHIGVFTTFLTSLGPILENVSTYTDSIDELSTSLTGLATSMSVLGMSGVLALPVLRGLEKVGLIGTNKTTAPITENKTTGKESSIGDLIDAFTDGTIPKLIAKEVATMMPNVHKVKLETSRAG
jgi:hypothetical protein